MQKCGIRTRDEHNNVTEHLKAVQSRFYICKVENGILYCSSPSKRGTVAEQQQRKLEYLKFRSKFNKILEEYKPLEQTVDYDDINPVFDYEYDD